MTNKDDQKSTELEVIARQNNLSSQKVQQLLSHFGTSFNEARKLAEEASNIVVTEEGQTELMASARTARLKFKNIRVAVEHTRKDLKEESLREGKAIDGMANIIKALIVPIEEHLEKQERFADLAQAERKHKRHLERIEKLSPFVANVEVYQLADIDDDVFETLLKQSKEAHQAQIDAQNKAEADRLAKEEADRKEQQRIRDDNERLKKEAEKREAEAQKEREKNRKIQEAKDEELRLEREKNEKAERERRAEEEATAKAKADAEEAERKKLLAPDKQKLMTFADSIDAIEMPNVSNRDAGKVLDETKDFLIRISKNLRNKAREL